MTTRQYVYKITAVREVVDGDTYDLVVDVGLYLYATIRVRLLGFDTPERHSRSPFERQEAIRATELAEAWFGTLPLGGDWWVRTEKLPDSFGRWLGDIWVETPDGSTSRVGEDLAHAGLATHWPTRWRDVYGNHGPVVR